MRRILTFLLVPVFGLGLVACDDDDGDGRVRAFCDRVIELEEEDAELDLGDPEIESIVTELLALAPNDEVRDALQTFFDVVEELAALEEEGDEEAAFGAAFELLFDPEVLQAGATLEEYLEEECGIEPEDGFDADNDIGFELDDDFDSNGDPLSGVAVREAVEAALPDVDIISTGSFTLAGETVVTIGIDLDSADPMEVCETVVAYADDVTGDDSTAVEITGPTGGDAVVEREPGGRCVAV